jgi:hypothetical protein
VVNTDPFGYIGDPPPTGPSGPAPEGPKGAWWVMGGAVLSIVPSQMIGGVVIVAPLVIALAGAAVIGLREDFATRRKAVDAGPAGRGELP